MLAHLHAVFDGQKINYFSDANFGDRTIANHAITLDQNGHVHLAYISKTWKVTYGSDPLGAGTPKSTAFITLILMETSWQNWVVIFDSTEERSW